MKQENRDIIITTDSLCDLPLEVVEEYGIGINPYRINTTNGSFLDGVEIDTKGLLIYMKDGLNSAKAFAATTDSYIAFFREQKKKADTVIHIFAAEYISSGFQRACEAAETVGNVYVFNSGQVSGGVGLAAVKAAQLVREGKNAQQILGILESYIKHVSTSFVVADTEHLVRLGKMYVGVSEMFKSMRIHPVVAAKEGKVKNIGTVRGNRLDVIRGYVRKVLVNPWSVDASACIIMHAGVPDEELEIIKAEVLKNVPFQNIYVRETSAVNACVAGAGAFGVIFARHSREYMQNEASQKTDLQSKVRLFLERYFGFLIKDTYPARHKLLNMILAVWILGTVVTGIATLFMNPSVQSIVGIIFLLTGLLVTLYLSTVKENYFAAAVLILILINFIAFPFMYFISGGVRSGMLAWMVLGLVVAWVLFEGTTAAVFYVLNVCMMIATMYASAKLPQLVAKVTEQYIYIDWAQSAIIVSTMVGAIYKFQNTIYEKQNLKLREHQEELVRATNAKSTFLANMSHEIRTPINGIMGMNSMLLKECGNNEVLKEYATNIQSASNALLSIVNDILDISKIESGKLELVQEEYDTFSVLNDCYNMTQSRAREKGLDFSIDIDPMLPARLFGDEVRVRQVINNFLSNAVKYTPAGSVKLSVGYRRNADAKIVMVISVKDSGIGIKKENLDQLFDAFSRFDEKLNKNIEGTGLGLNLTYNLVKMMGGEITVDSIYNQGSTFTAEIPQGVRSREYMGDFYENYKKLLMQNAVTANNIYAPDARVLIVDDVPMNLLVAKGLLKYTEIQVDTANSGMDALGMLMKQHYDLVLLDHMMPELDGIETFRRLKAMPDCINMNTPVVMLTANAVLGAKEEYLNAGFADYLTKPIVEKSLMELLARILPPELLRKKPENEEETIAAIRKAAGMPELKIPAAETIKPEKVRTGPEFAVKKPDIPKTDFVISNDDPIHIDIAMRYCMDSRDFYQEIAKAYVGEPRINQLQEAFQNKDMDAYCVAVHAVKSSSLTIGAVELSKHAKRLEESIKAGDYAVVEAEHEWLIKEYENVIFWVKRKYI